MKFPTLLLAAVSLAAASAQAAPPPGKGPAAEHGKSAQAHERREAGKPESSTAPASPAGTEAVAPQPPPAGESHERASGEAPAGLQKQSVKKALQERNETGKGSEQGQAQRAEHSRKWWKFWAW